MEEMVVESDSRNTSGRGSDQRVADAWESVTAALVSGAELRNGGVKLRLKTWCRTLFKYLFI